MDDDPFADLLGPPRPAPVPDTGIPMSSCITDKSVSSKSSNHGADTMAPVVMSDTNTYVMLKEDVGEFVAQAVKESVDATVSRLVGSMRSVLESVTTRMGSVEAQVNELKDTVKALDADNIVENLNTRFTHVDENVKELARNLQAMRDRAELYQAQAELAQLSAKDRCMHCKNEVPAPAYKASVQETTAPQSTPQPAPQVAPQPAVQPAPQIASPQPAPPVAAAPPPQVTASAPPPPALYQPQTPQPPPPQPQQPSAQAPPMYPQQSQPQVSPASYQPGAFPPQQPPQQQQQQQQYSQDLQRSPSVTSQSSNQPYPPPPPSQGYPPVQPPQPQMQYAAPPPGPAFNSSMAPPRHPMRSSHAPPPPMPPAQQRASPAPSRYMQESGAPAQQQSGTSQMSTAQVVAEICSMGFTQHQVESVIRQMISSGQNIDLNLIVDRLMNTSSSR